MLQEEAFRAYCKECRKALMSRCQNFDEEGGGLPPGHNFSKVLLCVAYVLLCVAIVLLIHLTTASRKSLWIVSSCSKYGRALRERQTDRNTERERERERERALLGILHTRGSRAEV
jgi:hypothetical protein